MINERALSNAVEPANGIGLAKDGNAGPCPICGDLTITEFLIAPDRFHLREESYRLLRCERCSCVWLSSPPKPEEMGVHYDEDYHRAIAAAGETSAASRWKSPHEIISRHKSGGSILDVGCSSGGFLGTMKGSSWRLYGIEMEETTAARARANTGAEVFVGDAVKAPFPPESFDVITCFDVLEHVYSPREFLEKVMVWLKPGGIYHAALPNISSWEAKIFGSYWYGLELPRHLFHFSPQSLRKLMSIVGFEEVSVATPNNSYIQRSVNYCVSDVIQRLGGSPRPQAKPVKRSVPWRAARKGMSLVFIAPFAWAGSLAGAGPSMEVVFKKPETADQN